MMVKNLKEEIESYVNYFETVKYDKERNELKNIYMGDEDYTDHVDRILVWEASHGDNLARELFILDKERYVRSIINKDSELAKFTMKGLEKDDLVQTGMIGVIETLKKYDFRKNVKVRSYLASMVKFSIKNAYRKYGAVSVSREANSVYSKCIEKIDLMSNSLSTSAVKEISKETGISENKIAESIMAVKFGNSTLSYDNEGYIEVDNKTMEKNSNKTIMDYVDKMNKIFDYHLILNAMKNLEKKEKYVMVGIYLKDKTQKEVANELGCSVATVGKYKRYAIAKIRMEVCDKSQDSFKY